MIESTKTTLRRTREFVVRHRTPIACAATAVTAVVITRHIDVRMNRDFAYGAGALTGIMIHHNGLLQQFIESEGLKDKFFQEFLPSINQ